MGIVPNGREKGRIGRLVQLEGQHLVARAVDDLGVDADLLAGHEGGADGRGLLLGDAVDDVGVLGALVDLDGPVGVLAVLLEVGLVVLRPGQGEVNEAAVAGDLAPLGLVVAAGVAG